MNRLFLDANSLLNAVFVPSSWSRTAVMEAWRRKVQIVIGPETLEEVVRKARDYGQKHGVAQDLWPTIRAALRTWQVLQVDRGDAPVPAAVPEHDTHVYREAAAAQATIVTSDVDLLHAAGQAAVTPLELLKQFRPEAVHHFVFGVTPSAATGMVFFRGVSQWSCPPQLKASFYAVQYDNGLGLFYDGQNGAWICELPGVGRLEVSAPVQAQISQTVGLSWTAGKQALLRVAGTEHPCMLPAPAEGVQGDFGVASVGSSRAAGAHWNGWVEALVVDDRPLGGVWQKIRNSNRATPNPYDSARVEAAIAAMRT